MRIMLFSQCIKMIQPGALLIMLLGLWQITCQVYNIPPYTLPSPLCIGDAAARHMASLKTHSFVSICEILSGLGLGCILSVITSIVCDYKNAWKRIIMPYLVVLKNLPIFVIAPLMMIWWGHGMHVKIFLIALSCYFPMAMGLLEGLSQGTEHMRDFLTLMRPASCIKSLCYVRLGYAMPSFFTGIKLAFIHAPMSVVACDWIGASSGLGYMMMLCYGRLDLPLMFACLGILMILSLSLYAACEMCRVYVYKSLRLPQEIA